MKYSVSKLSVIIVVFATLIFASCSNAENKETTTETEVQQVDTATMDSADTRPIVKPD